MASQANIEPQDGLEVPRPSQADISTAMAENDRPKVLIVFGRTPNTGEINVLARAFLDDGRFEPVIMLSFKDLAARIDDTVVGKIRLVDVAGAEISRDEIRAVATRANPVFRARLLASVRKMLLAVSKNWVLLDFAITLRSMYRQRGKVRTAFDRLEPAAVILFDDRSLSVDAPILAICRETGCPSLIAPYALSRAEGTALSRRYRLQHHIDAGRGRWAKRLIARLYPLQAYDSDYGRMIFYPVGSTIALKVIGMLSPRPWVLGGWANSTLAVFGERDREAAINMGVPKEKVFVSGQPSLDDLARVREDAASIRALLIERYDLAPDRPLLMCAVPQLGEHRILDWDTHWREIEFLFGRLAEAGANILLSLHPKMDTNAYNRIAEKYGISILHEPLRSVLPAAEIFVANYSSTVQWSILLRIPTVIVDFYEMNASFYDGIAGLLKVTDREKFRLLLDRLVNDANYRVEISSELAGSDARFAPLDGNASLRIIDRVAQIVAAPQSSRCSAENAR